MANVNKSRTKLSILNSQVSLFFYFLQIVLEFISRKAFIDTLGTEVVGLNTIAYNLLGFLNIAELGIGAAVAVTLYKPLFDKDVKTITEIVCLQGWLYKRIATFIIFSSIILMAFFPVLFEKTNLPLWYSYASFIVLLYASLLTYFINYKQIVLSADQKGYKILYSYKGTMMIGIIVQIIVLYSTSYGYISWLVFQFLFPTLAAIVLNKTIRKDYPFLYQNKIDGGALKCKYPKILEKIKQVFFHKISGYVLLQSSPLVVYSLLSLNIVTMYGNYLLITTGITRLIGSLFSSINAGVGNLIAQNDFKRIYGVFEEIFSSRFTIVSTLCFCMYVLTDSFISIWLGENYILNHIILCLLMINLYINTMRTVTDSFLQGYGLYSDIWAPIVEAVLNLGLSITLGYYYGLEGIILGITISLLLIVVMWKPIFLYRQGFKISIIKYIRLYIKHILVAIPIWIFTIHLYKLLFSSIVPDVIALLKLSCFAFFSHILLLTILMAIFIPSQRRFLLRIKNFLVTTIKL